MGCSWSSWSGIRPRKLEYHKNQQILRGLSLHCSTVKFFHWPSNFSFFLMESKSLDLLILYSFCCYIFMDRWFRDWSFLVFFCLFQLCSKTKRCSFAITITRWYWSCECSGVRGEATVSATAKSERQGIVVLGFQSIYKSRNILGLSLRMFE